MSCHAMRDPLRRLDRAFAAFFRRLMAGEKPGYPRFRSRRRYDSLTWDQWVLRGGRLSLPGIGHLKVRWHRPLPGDADLRTRNGAPPRAPLVRLLCSRAPETGAVPDAILTDKAEEAGRSVIALEPRHTSQWCSACEVLVPKPLQERWHRCAWGYEADRDVNAARNLYMARREPSGVNVAPRGVRCLRRRTWRQVRYRPCGPVKAPQRPTFCALICIQAEFRQLCYHQAVYRGSASSEKQVRRP